MSPTAGHRARRPRAALDGVRPGGPADHVNGVAPGWVVTPTTVEQVAGVLAVAHRAGAAAVPSRRRHRSSDSAPRHGHWTCC